MEVNYQLLKEKFHYIYTSKYNKKYIFCKMDIVFTYWIFEIMYFEYL